MAARVRGTSRLRARPVNATPRQCRTKGPECLAPVRCVAYPARIANSYVSMESWTPVPDHVADAVQAMSAPKADGRSGAVVCEASGNRTVVGREDA